MITLPRVDIKGGGGGAARPLCLCVSGSVNPETRCATSSRSSNGGKFCVTDTLWVLMSLKLKHVSASYHEGRLIS